MQHDIESIELEVPSGTNIILGQAHFIKSVEDLYEAVITASTNIKFGVAFNEASGDRLIRYDGNDKVLTAAAVKAAEKLACGHSFVVFLANAFPINIVNRIKDVDEVLSIFAATANSVKAIIYDDGEEGRSILGVIDGKRPLGVEEEKDKEKRHKFLRDIGYKR